MKERFLGRTFDEKTKTWYFPDGSGGRIPDECRMEIESFVVAHQGQLGSGISALAILWDWKKRLGIK